MVRCVYGSIIIIAFHSTAQPTLKNLQLIRWRDKNRELKKFYLKHSICIEWEKIGDLVDIPSGLLEAWGIKYREDPLKCIKPVLSHWLSNPTEDYPATWEGLYQLLEDIEYSEIAKQLRQCLDNATMSH